MFYFVLLVISMCMCLCVTHAGGVTPVTTCVWRPEDNLVVSSLFPPLPGVVDWVGMASMALLEWLWPYE